MTCVFSNELSYSARCSWAVLEVNSREKFSEGNLNLFYWRIRETVCILVSCLCSAISWNVEEESNSARKLKIGCKLFIVRDGFQSEENVFGDGLCCRDGDHRSWKDLNELESLLRNNNGQRNWSYGAEVGELSITLVWSLSLFNTSPHSDECLSRRAWDEPVFQENTDDRLRILKWI